MIKEVEVSIRLGAKGQVIPVSFVWKGKAYRINAIGRRWDEQDGEHILVMTVPDNKAWELIHAQKEGCWKLRIKGHDRPTITVA